MLHALKRTPGRHERGVYLAVIAVMALCLLAVMSLNRSLMTARAHDRAAYVQLRVAMDQVKAAAAMAKDARRQAEDTTFTEWLELSLSRYECPEFGVVPDGPWREHARKWSAAQAKESPEQAMAWMARAGMFGGGMFWVPRGSSPPPPPRFPPMAQVMEQRFDQLNGFDGSSMAWGYIGRLQRRVAAYERKYADLKRLAIAE
jgi:hypothetical protein